MQPIFKYLRLYIYLKYEHGDKDDGNDDDDDDDIIRTIIITKYVEFSTTHHLWTREN